MRCILIETMEELVGRIGLHSPGVGVAGTALGRGWYDGTSFAGKKFRRESPAPGISDIGTSFAGGLMSPGPISPGILAGGPISPGIEK